MRRWGCCCRHQEACVRAQVTLHSPPPGSRCSPPPPGSHDPGTTSPGECAARLGLVQRHDASAAADSPRIPYPPSLGLRSSLGGLPPPQPQGQRLPRVQMLSWTAGRRCSPPGASGSPPEQESARARSI